MVAMIFIRGQESSSFRFPVLGSLGASLLARGSKRGRREQAVVVYVVMGDCMLAVGCRSQPGSQA